jgi:hypothetical protein
MFRVTVMYANQEGVKLNIHYYRTTRHGADKESSETLWID